MAYPDTTPAFDVASSSWRDFTRANTPPSRVQRAVARFCDRFVSTGTLARVGCLRRAVEACRGWDASEAAFRERFVEKTLRARAPDVPGEDLAGIVARLAPRRVVVDDDRLRRILAEADAAQRAIPLPALVELALMALDAEKGDAATDGVRTMPPRSRGAIDLEVPSLALARELVDGTLQAVRNEVRGMTPGQRAALTGDDVRAMYDRLIDSVRHTL